MLQLRSRERVWEWIGGLSVGRPSAALRVLLLAAHPDDETIGASAALARLSHPTIVYLTDGAPRDPHLRSPHVAGDREFYASVRAEEAASALALVRVPQERIIFLGGIDQEAIQMLPALLKSFMEVLDRLSPEAIITHPYEGGHPDHDVAALVAYLAAHRWEQDRRVSPYRLEMTSYHAVHGHRVSGEFLPYPANSMFAHGQAGRMIRFSHEERARKTCMMQRFASQWHLLPEFPLEPERLRVAPVYDFTKPPHEGRLWYECLGWPMSGRRWREIALETFASLGDLACP